MNGKCKYLKSVIIVVRLKYFDKIVTEFRKCKSVLFTKKLNGLYYRLLFIHSDQWRSYFLLVNGLKPCFYYDRQGRSVLSISKTERSRYAVHPALADHSIDQSGYL